MKTNITLFDHSNKLYVRISHSKEGWERWVSKTRQNWKLTHKALSMDDALKFKEQIIDNNYRNLLGLIVKK
jgi:hypothetical protein